jgi:hypothetical protein
MPATTRQEDTMNATATQPRTREQLEAAAAEHGAKFGPNAAYHAGQYVARQVAAAEREAYWIEDRRTIRPRYIAALDAARTRDSERAQAAAARYNAARRAAGLRFDTTFDYSDTSDVARAARSMIFANSQMEAARNALARATAPGTGTPEAELIAAAEAGEIEPSDLLATVPDEFGRCSAFAVFVQSSRRGYAIRNLRLHDALTTARRLREPGQRAEVGRDLCG